MGTVSGVNEGELADNTTYDIVIEAELDAAVGP
jgi:hypothetical protein